LKSAETEVIKVKDLEGQLEKLKSSSASDKQSALDNLKSELQNEHQEEAKTWRSTHESELLKLRSDHDTEMSKLKSTYDEQVAVLSRFQLREELRRIKAGFEEDKQTAMSQAVEAATAQRESEMVRLRQHLESTLMELTEAKNELEMLTKLKRIE
jgi:hypothetical protein